MNEERKRLLTVGGAIAVALLAIAGLAFLIINKNSGNGSVDMEQDTVSKIRFENSGFVSNSIGGEVFDLVSGDIEAVVASEAEVAAAPKENNPGEGVPAGVFVANIDNSGFLQGVSFPYSTFSFDFTLSDGRSYSVSAASNTPSYYGVLIWRKTPKQDVPRVFMVFLKSETQGGYNRMNVMQNLEKWAKKISPSGFNLTTRTLF